MEEQWSPGFQSNYHRQPPQSQNFDIDDLKILVKGLAMSQKALENQLGQIATTLTARPLLGHTEVYQVIPRPILRTEDSTMSKSMLLG